MAKNLIELTSKLVEAQLASGPQSLEDIVEHIQTIHATLSSLASAEAAAEQAPQFADPKDSIGRQEVTCLECGGAFRLLSNRHLGLHGLTPRSYKQKHGIRMTQPLSSRSLTAQRKRYAKENGMGKQLAAWRAGQRESKAVGD